MRLPAAANHPGAAKARLRRLLTEADPLRVVPRALQASTPGRAPGGAGTIDAVPLDGSNQVGPVAAARATARDLGYLAVGFGILGFQRVQVRRRELEARIRDGGGPGRAPAMAARALDSIAGPVADRIDATLALAAEQAPEPARSALRQAREGGRDARRQLRRAGSRG